MVKKLKAKFKSVEEYISLIEDKEAKTKMEEVRKTIKNAAPDAIEVISYSIPAFKQNGMLVWYAAFKEHIGFYPRTSAIEAFKDELMIYKSAKGSVQFPLYKPIPHKLITKIVKFRVEENMKNGTK